MTIIVRMWKPVVTVCIEEILDSALKLKHSNLIVLFQYQVAPLHQLHLLHLARNVRLVKYVIQQQLYWCVQFPKFRQYLYKTAKFSAAFSVTIRSNGISVLGITSLTNAENSAGACSKFIFTAVKAVWISGLISIPLLWSPSWSNVCKNTCWNLFGHFLDSAKSSGVIRALASMASPSWTSPIKNAGQYRPQHI